MNIRKEVSMTVLWSQGFHPDIEFSHSKSQYRFLVEGRPVGNAKEPIEEALSRSPIRQLHSDVPVQ